MNPTLEELRGVDVLADLSDTDLSWIARRAQVRSLAPGELFVHAGESADHMHFMLAGQIEYGGDPSAQGLHWVVTAGEVAGMLPYSRMTVFPNTAHALGLTRVALLHKDHFPALKQAVPHLMPKLLEVMTRRIREAAQAQEQRERMSALGKLAAGLAHELNNPAAAVRRTAGDLALRMGELPDLLERWWRHRPEEGQLHDLEALGRAALARANEHLGPVKRGELEDDLADYLADEGVARAAERAATLVDAGVRLEDLKAIREDCPDGFSDALAYLEFRLSSLQMLRDIEGAAKRISDLVGSIKSYSHMDRGGDRAPTDVRVGLESTLTMLGHKLKQKDIRVQREYAPDLPSIPASEGELNQVWTNLIDNATDALPPGGTLTLRADVRGGQLAVSVIDNGPGIPPELQGRIFEPFFTTKGVGQGTGLGLDLVQRVVTRAHGGVVRASSEPGRTEFLVLLPLAQSAAHGAGHLPDDPEEILSAAPPSSP